MPVQHATIQKSVSGVHPISRCGRVDDSNLRTSHQPSPRALIQTWPISHRAPIIALKVFKISRDESHAMYHGTLTVMSVESFDGRRWTRDCQYFVTVKRHEYKNRIYKHGFRSRHFWHLTNSLLPEWLFYINIHPKRIYRMYRKSIIEVKKWMLLRIEVYDKNIRDSGVKKP